MNAIDFLNLPESILVDVLAHCPPEDALRCEAVCLQVQQAVQSPVLMKKRLPEVKGLAELVGMAEDDLITYGFAKMKNSEGRFRGHAAFLQVRLIFRLRYHL